MFISVLPGEQVEVLIAEDAVIQEYYVEMLHQQKNKGDIYKGIINNVDPALQAAFVNYGAVKNGFLQIDEVHPEYYLTDHDASKHKYPLIQKVLKAGQEVLVQIVKEPVGSKGAFLTSYLSLPGRHLVLTPGREQIGVSRKIEDEKERDRLKQVIDSFKSDRGVGIIVRTASTGESKTNLSKDFQFLKRLWKEVRARGREVDAPNLIHREPDLATRAIRDYMTEDIGEVWVDDPETVQRLKDFSSLVAPRNLSLIKLYAEEDCSLYERFNLQKQVEQIYAREVHMPSGGRLVFDQTEALMAVDINSGKIGGKSNFQEMALKTNMEAAEVIAQQLKLRDVGGQIVIDFIEMKDSKHCREVEKTLKTQMKSDRARYDVGKMSKFGLLQVVRQRMGTSALAVSTETCPCCGGSGTRRNMEWQSLQAIKELYRLLRAKNCPEIVEYATHPELAAYLLNKKRAQLIEMEQKWGRTVHVTAGVR
ncbi:MAG: ribonuclease E/G [Desulfovibrionaceae bacterium]